MVRQHQLRERDLLARLQAAEEAKETLELLLQMDMFSEGELGAEDFVQAAAPEPIAEQFASEEA